MSNTAFATPIAAPAFERDDYLDGDPYEGTLRTRDGRRMIALPEDLIVGLHNAISRETGRAWPIVAYRCGKKWGEGLFESWESSWKAQYGVGLLEGEFRVFEAWLTRLFAHFGWGKLSFDFSRQDDGLISACVENSIFARLLGDLEDGRVCGIMAGLFGAVVSKMAGRELEAVELRCQKDGHQHCEFVVGTPGRIERARRVRLQHGRSDEMLEELMKPDND